MEPRYITTYPAAGLATTRGSAEDEATKTVETSTPPISMTRPPVCSTGMFRRSGEPPSRLTNTLTGVKRINGKVLNFET